MFRSRRRPTTVRFSRPRNHPAWMIFETPHNPHDRETTRRGEGEEGRAGWEGKKRRAIHVKAAATTTTSCSRLLRDAKSGHGVSRRSRADTKAEDRKRRKRREHAPRREEKGEPVPTEVSSKLTGPWLLWASECLARGPGFRYPGKPPQQERWSSGGGNKKVSLERT